MLRMSMNAAEFQGIVQCLMPRDDLRGELSALTTACREAMVKGLAVEIDSAG